MERKKHDGDSREKLEEIILHYLDKKGDITDSRDFLSKHGQGLADHEGLESVLRSLHSSQLVKLETAKEETGWGLSTEGAKYLTEGSPEGKLFHAIPSGGVTLPELTATLGFPGPVFAGALGQAKKYGWIDVQNKKAVKKVATIEDKTQGVLKQIHDGKKVDEKFAKELEKRTLITSRTLLTHKVTKGDEFALERTKQATDLTAELIQSGDWKSASFKEYNFGKAKTILSGALHPLCKVKTEVRSILVAMGFEEMPTNNYVESSFWNFDALFQPQSHPCRDSHDTFFLTEPAEAHEVPEDYAEQVKVSHEKGSAGSIGYRYKWEMKEAKKNILRTHTTASSARMLHRLAHRPFTPKKYFSVDRVFRNESVDMTHLAEFHQVEGLVADYDLTLGDLIGVIQTFFKKIGQPNIRFKPTYNPYTEPSMEIYGYSEQLKKWIEVGNSGVFRPEMLAPMGFPPNVTVIAWGLSLERPTMIKYGIGNIRNLFGHKVDLRKIVDSPICRWS